MDDVNVIVSTRTLTDGSKVFDVVVGGLSLPAHDEAAAMHLACDIVDAIRTHTHVPAYVGGE
jgi:hypothetical protein